MRATNSVPSRETSGPSDPREERLDALEVREAIEGLAARLAARAAKDEPQRASLEGTVAEMTSAALCNDSIRYAAAHVRFHRQLLGASGNRWLRRMSWLVCDGAQHTDAGATPPPPSVVDAGDHELLVQAIGDGDAGLAESLATAQIQRLMHASEARIWSPELQS
jgi:DNA-binding GntR family transcriptional regulator